MLDLTTIVNALALQRDRLNAAISALEGASRAGRRYRRGLVSAKRPSRGRKRRRTMSASTRRELSARMKARWAKVKKAGKRSL